MNQDRFPAVLAAVARGRVLADNAAGTQLPDTALERVATYLTYDNAQRGSIFARENATNELYLRAQAEFAALLDVPEAHVGIGANATSIAMSFSRLLASAIARGDRIVVTAADHEANIAPWVWLRRFGAQIDVVPVDAQGDLDEAKYRAFLERAPVLVALPWASNATGTVFDVARLARMAKDTRATVVVDGVQALPHFALEIDEAIDFAMFSAYKIYAPHVGFWYASRTVLDRFVRSDDTQPAGTDARNWTLECGTQSYEALAGWLGTMTYLRDLAETPRLALEVIARNELELSAYVCAHFAERGPRLRLYGKPPAAARLPVFAFNIEGMPSDELAERFEGAGIEARVGDYYAPRLMQRIAPETRGRAVRLSFVHYNTHEEVDRCFDVIDAALDGAAPETAPVPEFSTEAFR